jgi:hypothetical protein
MTLPPDWQAQLIEVIAGRAPADPRWFTGGPILSPAQQIGIYQEQYQLRMYDALVEDLPGFMRLLGDDAPPLLRAFLRDHPSQTWTLDRVTHALPRWLEAHGHPAAHVDMAALDVAVAISFQAADGVPLDPAAIHPELRLRLSPHVRLLHLRSNVAWIRAAVGGDAAPALQAGDRPTIVFRRGLHVRHAEIEAGWWALLRRIGGGCGLIDAIAAVGGEDQPAIGGWMREMVELGWVEVAPLGV